MGYPHFWRETYLLGYAYFYTVCETANASITDEMLESYYVQHSDEMRQQGIDKNSGKYYSLRHLLALANDNSDSSWKEARRSRPD